MPAASDLRHAPDPLKLIAPLGSFRCRGCGSRCLFVWACPEGLCCDCHDAGFCARLSKTRNGGADIRETSPPLPADVEAELRRIWLALGWITHE